MKPELHDAAAMVVNGTTLSQRHAAFVSNFVANGGRREEAAASAGYAEASLKSAASRLLRNPLIQQAILLQTRQAISLHAVAALARVAALKDSAKSDFVKLEAAKDLLDRAGFSPPARVSHAFDSGLTVTLELGGSKSAGTDEVTVPRTGKSDPELVATPDEPSKTLDLEALGGDFFAAETIDLPAILENATEQNVENPKTRDER